MHENASSPGIRNSVSPQNQKLQVKMCSQESQNKIFSSNLSAISLPTATCARYSVGSMLSMRQAPASLSISRKARRAIFGLGLWKPRSGIDNLLRVREQSRKPTYDHIMLTNGEVARVYHLRPLSYHQTMFSQSSLRGYVSNNESSHPSYYYSHNMLTKRDYHMRPPVYSPPSQQSYGNKQSADRHDTFTWSMQRHPVNQPLYSSLSGRANNIDVGKLVTMLHVCAMVFYRAITILEVSLRAAAIIAQAQPNSKITNANVQSEHSKRSRVNKNAVRDCNKAETKYKNCNERVMNKMVVNKQAVNRSCRSNDQLHVTSANINGLRGKLDSVKIHCLSELSHIYACQETKIGSKITNESLAIPGYKLVRKDRSESGGGVALYVKESIKHLEIKKGIADALELVAVKCRFESKNLIIATVYRPPKYPVLDFVENLTNFISSLGDDSKHLILTGDLNICALKPEFNVVKNICSVFKLRQLIQQPTHNARLIDQIFVSELIYEKSAGIGAPIEKIHASTWVKVEMVFTKEAPKISERWCFKKADWQQINLYLIRLNTLTNIQLAKNVHDATILLQNNTQNAMSEFIPKKKYVNKNTLGWMSQKLFHLHKQKDKSYRKWKQNGLQSKKSEYKKLAKQFKKAMFLQKKEHFEEIFSRCHDQSSFWRSVKCVTGKSQQITTPTLLLPSGKEANTDVEKCECLRNQFASVFMTDNSTTETKKVDTEKFAKRLSINIKYLLRKISKLPNKKAMGCDGIPAMVIKNCSLVLAPCLAEIANRCLLEMDFPSVWKQAIVLPIPKKFNSSNPGDYRPVSLLPLFSKLVESSINDIMLQFIEPLLSDLQYGFRKGRSTTEALLVFQHFVLEGFKICERAKQPGKVIVVYFDISKAFDCVPHSKLLDLINSKFSLPVNLVKFIKSYLNGRSMSVKVGSALSSNIKATSGVPQGSVVGPTLFVAYIDAITELRLSTNSHIILFADDMVLIHALENGTSHLDIQEDISKISGCVDDLGLKLNASKCQYQIISLAPAAVDANLTLVVNDVKLDQVQVYKYLGVEVDDRLSFVQQSSKAATKAKQGIGCLVRSMRRWASRDTLSVTMSTIVFPAFLYAVEIWFPPNVTQQKRLEKVSKYAARIILNDFSQSTSYENLLEKMNWMPLHKIVATKRLINMKKYLSGLKFLPDFVFPLDCDNEQSIRSSARLRNHSKTVKIFRDHKNSLDDKLVAAKSRLLWNSLDEDTVNIINLPNFINAITQNSMFTRMCSVGAISPLTDI